jgi:hypothetical protein
VISSTLVSDSHHKPVITIAFIFLFFFIISYNSVLICF